MRGPFKLNRRQRQSRSISSEYQKTRQSKSIRIKCSSAIKLIKLTSAILVPLMIGVFTLITTLRESKSVELRQEAEKQQRELDVLKIKEQQQRDDMNAKEIRMQNIYDTFMKEISSIVLKDNINLTKAEITFARAKTVLTLEQIDPKRKWYLIKFLYDNQLLYTSKWGMKYLDLAEVDLSNVNFGGKRQFGRRTDLSSILLSNIQLRNSTFENVGLSQANFVFSDLNNSNFIGVSMSGASFMNTIMENSKLVLSNLGNSSFKDSKLKLSSWSVVSSVGRPVFANVDYSDCDLSESTFQGMKIATSVKFDRVNFARTNFIDVVFSNGMSFNDINMQMSNFIKIELTGGEFIKCNMVGAIFEKIMFKNVNFEHVDLRESQFIDIPDYGSIQFRHVNLIGSNLNVTREKLFRITDSFLPNGTFKTSFMSFGMNLIKNGDAEQGQCYDFNQNLTTAPKGWSHNGDVAQIYYENNTDWKMNSTNYSSDWHSCFFGSYRRGNSSAYSIRQEINVEQLSALINARRARYQASAYLGGFEDEQSSTSIRISFKNTINKTIGVENRLVTNIDRQNKTAMLYRAFNATLPNGTILIDIELTFSRQKSQTGSKFGMADNLKFIIQQK